MAKKTLGAEEPVVSCRQTGRFSMNSRPEINPLSQGDGAHNIPSQVGGISLEVLDRGLGSWDC